MTASPVEAVLVVFYGPAAHAATYGRLRGDRYTKDYIQLSRSDEFQEAVEELWGPVGDVSLTYRWPRGSATGSYVRVSADRPHLKWETREGAPPPWRMTVNPTDLTAETIPGDPSHTSEAAADNEFDLLASRDAGQPYLVAVRLLGDPNTLHLRAYLGNAGARYAWADVSLTPPEIQALAGETSRTRALRLRVFDSGGTAPSPLILDALGALGDADDPVDAAAELTPEQGAALAVYLRSPGRGLFFDPTRNHDAWSVPEAIPDSVIASLGPILEVLTNTFPATSFDDVAAETSEADPDEVAGFEQQIAEENFAVPDATATIKTRGSAQRAFAKSVKANYGHTCAVTGISTRDFLIAAHIVPWSEDPTIRLDPSNGICLSPLVDRAYDKGYLSIGEDFTVSVDRARIGTDTELLRLLEPYDGRTLSLPLTAPPRADYLRRRIALVTPEEL